MPTEKQTDKPVEKPAEKPKKAEPVEQNPLQGIRVETDPGAAQDDPDAGVVH